jgi:uncharacterized protein (DUF111 family)
VYARIVAGRGFVDTAHGRCPVPAPATLAILAGSGLSWEYGSIEHELLTPTGAAILAHLADRVEPGSAGSGGGCVATGIGYGAGKADLEIPNVLRVIRCEDERRGQGHGHVQGLGADADMGGGRDASLGWDGVEVLETSVDDVTGEVLGNLIEELMAMGANDAIVIPATMKKGRSGHLIQVIALGTDRTQDHRGDRFAWRADLHHQTQVDCEAGDGFGQDRDRWHGVGCRGQDSDR